MYCNNCGILGHTYNKCKNPIMSYGIIAINPENSKILMINRKDSLCYIDFLRGRYSLYDIDYIIHLCNRFSHAEKEKIVASNYDELWSDLWKYNTKLKSHIKNEYKSGKNKFEKLKEGIIIDDKHIDIHYIYNNIKTSYSSTEWEFPKGRRNAGETNRNCAIREFEEETGITSDDYSLFMNVMPISEVYIGENDIKYKHVYYFAQINQDIIIKISSLNNEQLSEVSDIQWLTKNECINHIRSYNKTKFKIIDIVFKFIQNYKKDLCKYCI